MIRIPDEFTVATDDKLAFNTGTMRRLYALGERMGASVDSWDDVPPGTVHIDARAPVPPAVQPDVPQPAPIPAPAGALPPPTVRNPGS